jgi:hypothetical protein
MDRSSRSALPEGPAAGLAPPPLRLLQPWAPAAARAASREALASHQAAPGWRRRLLDLLLSR